MTMEAKETRAQRAARIAESGNGATLRTRVAPDRKKYSRKEKHKGQSIARAMDFAFYGHAGAVLLYLVHGKD